MNEKTVNNIPIKEWEELQTFKEKFHEELTQRTEDYTKINNELTQLIKDFIKNKKQFILIQNQRASNRSRVENFIGVKMHDGENTGILSDIMSYAFIELNKKDDIIDKYEKDIKRYREATFKLARIIYNFLPNRKHYKILRAHLDKIVQHEELYILEEIQYEKTLVSYNRF